jgi:periplasmic divalent cation tolerance protein
MTAVDILLIFTNLPDRASALGLARDLVEARCAACVNVLGGCTSVYRWQGEIETAEEVPVLIKTRSALYGAVEQAIRARHPYDVPEIIAVPVSQGLPSYLEWVETATLPPASDLIAGAD